MNGVFDFAQLNAVAVHQAGDDRQAVCHPAIGLRTGRSAIYCGHELIDIWRAIAPEIISRVHSEACRHGAAAFCQTLFVPELGESRLG